MVLATSNSSYVGQAKATCLGSAVLMCSDPGANDRRSPGRPQTSPGRGAHPTGSVCRREPEPRDLGFTILVFSICPISRPSNLSVRLLVFLRAAYCSLFATTFTTCSSQPTSRCWQHHI